MRKISKDMIGRSPLQIGMSARGLKNPITQVWEISGNNETLTNAETGRTIPARIWSRFKAAAEWDGVLAIMACFTENK